MITTAEIELILMRNFDYVGNVIVPNVTPISNLVSFEVDLIVLTHAGYATGFEIKVSKEDLKADFTKEHYQKIKEQNNWELSLSTYYNVFKYFYYAVPRELKDIALELIPETFGLVLLSSRFMDIERKPKKISNYKWTEEQKFNLARLGAMRLFSLKEKLIVNQKMKLNEKQK